MTCRIYCAVFGCMNSSLTHAEMTFFKLPGKIERRLQWLQLIGRDDLENKPNFTSYRVCEKHFNVEDILQSSNRKLLKKNALPLLMLSSLVSTVPRLSRKEDKQTQTVPLRADAGSSSRQVSAPSAFTHLPERADAGSSLRQVSAPSAGTHLPERADAGSSSRQVSAPSAFTHLPKRADAGSSLRQVSAPSVGTHLPEVENDMENYIRYRLMGGQVRLKKGVLPHEFNCQRKEDATVERVGYKKREQIEYVKRVLNPECDHENLLIQEEFVACETIDLDSNDTEAKNPLEEDNAANLQNDSKYKSLAVQVNIKPKQKIHHREQGRVVHGCKYAVHTHLNRADAGSSSRQVSAPSTGTHLPEAEKIIASMYRYLQSEYDSLKSSTCDACDLSPLANILKRTAAATGVSERTVTDILQRVKRPVISAVDTVQNIKRTKFTHTLEDDDVSPIEEELSCGNSADFEEPDEDEEEKKDQYDPIETIKVDLEDEEEDHSEDLKKKIRDDMAACETTYAVHHLLSPAQTEVKFEPQDMDYQQTSSAAHRLLSSSRDETQHEPSDVLRRQADPAALQTTSDVTTDPLKTEPWDDDTDT